MQRTENNVIKTATYWQQRSDTTSSYDSKNEGTPINEQAVPCSL